MHKLLKKSILSNYAINTKRMMYLNKYIIPFQENHLDFYSDSKIKKKVQHTFIQCTSINIFENHQSINFCFINFGTIKWEKNNMKSKNGWNQKFLNIFICLI